MSYVKNLRDFSKQLLHVFLWNTKEFPQCQVENYKQERNHTTHVNFWLTTQARFGIRLLVKVNGKWVDAQPCRSVSADDTDYDLHLGTKLN